MHYLYADSFQNADVQKKKGFKNSDIQSQKLRLQQFWNTIEYEQKIKELI